MWTAISILAILGICALLCHIWMRICQAKEVARLLAERAEVADKLSKALVDEPENLQLHLRWRASLRDIDRLLSKYQGD